MSDQKLDPELGAMQSIIGALDSLDDDAKKRVLAYVLTRLGIETADLQRGRRAGSRLTVTGKEPSEDTVDDKPIVDIRSFKESKSPESAIEMAILVAYYLSELAPIEERKRTVSTKDLEKYFKQAKYRLPSSISDVLPNAKKSGYLISVSRGQYKLNSVGYNLAAHVLPRKKPK